MIQYNTLSDDDLWQCVKAGDPNGLSTLYQRHLRMLLAEGARIGHNKSRVPDAIHDLFAELWYNYVNIAAVQHVPSYLKGALRFKLLRQTLREKKQSAFLLNDYQESIEELLVEAEVKTEQQHHLNRHLQCLPRRQQQALALKYSKCLTNEQIAETMDISYQSAANLISKSLRFLRENMKG